MIEITKDQFAFGSLVKEIEDGIISEVHRILSIPTDVSVDLIDLETVLSKTGYALVGIGDATGENRAIEAIRNAFQLSEIQKKNLPKAGIVLMSILCGKENGLEMEELTLITECLHNQLPENTEIIFGHAEMEDMNGIKVLVVVSVEKEDALFR